MPIIILLFLSKIEIQAQESIQNLHFTHALHDFPAARSMLRTSYLHAAFRNDFCTKEMMFKELEFDFIHQQDALLTTITHYGYGSFGELAVHIGYGRRFGNKVAVALRGVYLLNHATHYAPRHSFTVDFSICYKINAKLCLSVALFNPIRMKYGITGEEVIPMRFELQGDYQPNEKLLISLYGSKTLPGELDIGARLHFQPKNNLILSSIASITNCGIGISIPWKGFVFNVQGQWYYRISVSPGCGVGYYFKKECNDIAVDSLSALTCGRTKTPLLFKKGN